MHQGAVTIWAGTVGAGRAAHRRGRAIAVALAAMAAATTAALAQGDKLATQLVSPVTAQTVHDFSEPPSNDADTPADFETGFPPRVTDAVCRPKIVVDGQEVAAGAGFYMQIGPRRLLLTALSNFGSKQGFDTPPAGAELGEAVERATCVTPVLERTEPLAKVVEIADAEPMNAGGTRRDLVAFRTTDAWGLVLRGREEPVRIGDPVYVIAPNPSERGDIGAPLTHAASIAQVTETMIAFLPTDAPDLQPDIGAPVVDEEGRVIGLLAALRERSGSVFAFAVPIDRITEVLAPREGDLDPLLMELDLLTSDTPALETDGAAPAAE
ncbi:MAG: S1C family serine protease [Pseudomonadota bacterium]